MRRNSCDIWINSRALPNGALQTNKVLVYTGLIYPWSWLTNYLYKNQYLIHTKRCKKVPPLHLHIRLFKRVQKGGRGRSESRGFCNLICRSLFHYYSDIFYYSTVFPSKRRKGESERGRERGGGQWDRGGGRWERKGQREIERGQREEERINRLIFCKKKI